MIKILSLTLLWRALDVKKYFNSSLIIKLLQEPVRGEPKKPHLLVAYFKIYKLCFKNLVWDFVYWWAIVLMLKFDTSLWNLCTKKLDEQQYRTVTTVGGDKITEF
jgi:hypothetical protein